MTIDLYLNASAKRIANHLLNLRPDGALGSWKVESYQIVPRIYETAIRLSILAFVRRQSDAGMLIATVLLQELDTDRCMLSLSANPTLTMTGDGKEAIAHGWEPEIALFAWLLGKSRLRRAYPEIDDQLAELAAELAPAAVVEEAAAVIGGGEALQGKPAKPGPRDWGLEYKLKAWNGWLGVRGRQSQQSYCDQLDPPISSRTLRNWRDDLIREELLNSS